MKPTLVPSPSTALTGATMHIVLPYGFLGFILENPSKRAEGTCLMVPGGTLVITFFAWTSGTTPASTLLSMSLAWTRRPTGQPWRAGQRRALPCDRASGWCMIPGKSVISAMAGMVCSGGCRRCEFVPEVQIASSSMRSEN
jgi:hypothetical protein